MSEEHAVQNASGGDESKQEEKDVQTGDGSANDQTGDESTTSPRKRTIIFAVGLFLLVVGFLVLNQASPAADNWAGKISPLLIIGGYGVIFWSLWI